ncbi:MAG TPA: prepilin peptidase [Elusimicrobiales bacterium]|nr:prepilin peptidase [Elusimicrobiales bacterium]
MLFLSLAAATFFGLIVGSFLNVCIYRLPREKSIVWPGSACPSCGHAIRWYDNVPVFSYLFLLGKCRDCSSKISFRYPLVELLTGVLTLLFTLRYWQTPLWLVCCLVAVYALIVITFIDIDFMIIPDQLSLGLAVLGLLSSPVNPLFEGAWTVRVAVSLLGAAVGFGIIWILASVGELMFKKEAIGGGDLKLMTAAGAIAGWQGVVVTLMIGSLLGSIYGGAMLLSKKLERKQPIPFGPFLCAALLLYLYKPIPLSAFLWQP